jgi:hypothetical protein
MKAAFVVGAFLAAGLIASPVFAKQGDPIPGVPIGLEGDPGSVLIAQAKTNRAGVAVFQNVKPGKYRLTVGTINWGDGSTARAPISKKPTVVIKINVPGQATISENESPIPNTRSMNAEQLSFSIRFIVSGDKLQTVAATITQGAGAK